MASVWGELKRRNVVKVAVAYAIVGWLLIEVSSVLGPALNLPDWATTLVAFLLILGFPVAMLLTWAYELTPEGMKKTKSVPLSESITRITGRKLDFLIIGVLAIAVAFFAVDRFVLQKASETEIVADESVEPSPPIVIEEQQDVLPNSVAVLPFENLSLDPEDAFFAAGIHEEILNQLVKLRALNVIARTSVMQYAGGDKSIPEIAEELNVQTVMEGSVRYADDRVLVTAQLIDPDTNAHLWSESYNRDFSDIFALQADIAMNIANALEVEFSLAEQASIESVPTQSGRALEFYLSGREYARDPDEDTALPAAIQQFERALEEDPGFAIAWAALSQVHSELGEFRAAEEAVQRAFDLVPNLPEGHLALAEIYYWESFNYARALEEYAIAERSMPRSAEIMSAQAMTYRRMGRYDEAFASWDRALMLDPRNIEELVFQGYTYSDVGNFARAKQSFDRALEIAPDSPFALRASASLSINGSGDLSLMKALVEDPLIDLGPLRQWLGWHVTIYERDYEAALSYLDEVDSEVFREQEHSQTPTSSFYGVTYALAQQPDQATAHFRAARETIEEALEGNPEHAGFHNDLGEVLVGLGENTAAVRLARRAIELEPVSRDSIRGGFVWIEAITRVLVPAGEYDAAIDELDAYLAGNGAWSIEGLLPDPRLDPIRDDPRFQALVERYRRQ